MEKEPQRVAKGQKIALMQDGYSWKGAATMAGLQISRRASSRLLRKVRMQGEAGLQDDRHGRASQTAGTREAMAQ